jgi:hypothetical protein
MGRLGRVVAASAAGLVALTASGCGSLLEGGGGTAPDGTELPSMKALWSQMREATLAAESGHVTGFVAKDGESVSLDVEGRRDGSNQRARIKGSEGAVTILTVGKRTYVKGDWDFWTSAGAESKVATRMKNRFVTMSAKDTAELGDDDETFGELIDEMLDQETLGVTDTFGASVSKRTQGDREVWVGKDLRGNEFWVDTETNLLVRLVVEEEDGGTLTFDRWNRARTFKKPAKVLSF